MNTPYTLFMIDDDPEEQFFFSMALENTLYPFHCIFSDSGLKALDKLRSEPEFVPDFIILDINMPLINGMECLSEIRKIDYLKDVPVYMYSTPGDPKIVENCLALGATGVIQKMTGIDSITEFLNELGSRQRTADVYEKQLKK